MISQLLSQTKTPSILDLGGAQPAKGGAAGPQGAFALVLSMLGGAVQGKQGAEGADEAVGKTAAAAGEIATVPGVTLPDVAGTGKTLPDAAEALPEKTPDVAAPADAAPADGATAMLALVAPQIVQADAAVPAVTEGKMPASTPQLPAGLPLAAQQLASDAAAPAKGEGAKPAAQPAVAIQVAPVPSEGTAQRDPALPTEKPQADLATRLQPNTASADRQPQRDLAGGERPAADAAVKVASKAPAEAAPTQPMTPAPAPATPIAAAPAAPAADAAPAVAADKPAIETGIARELSRIVDSLASAREAMTAKGATLALDHAEFGELSLRFDQRRDGQLAVQLAAADPDAHRAVAAAVADRPAFAQPDGSQQNAQNGGNASARGALADRDGGSAEGNAPRHERQDERRRDDAGTNHTSGNGTRGDSSAIYA